jgi:PAS domain S-box-containing protein/putative nucleotidyltransferase with HDIG domain
LRPAIGIPLKRYIILANFLLLFLLFTFSATVFADDPMKVRVGIYENEPKIFTDEKGNPEGFWTEIIGYISAEEGWTVEYIHLTWPEYQSKLSGGEIDIMPDVAYTEERSKVHDFSNEPVYTSWSRVYTRRDTGILSVLDLEGRKVAVLKGSVNVEGPEGIKIIVRRFGVTCTFIETDSYISVFELVQKGEADAGVASKDFGYLNEQDYNLVDTAILFQPANIYFAFPKGSSLSAYLIERIDYHVKAMKEDQNSVYYLALAKWMGAHPIEKPVMPSWVIWTLAAIGGVVLLLAGGSFILRLQVRARTRELTAEISERTRVEEALRDSEERMRATFESMSEGLVITDLKGKITNINPATVHLHGFKQKDELIGKNASELIIDKDRAKAAKNSKKAFRNGSSSTSEYTLLTGNGKKFSAEMSTALLKDSFGNPTSFVYVTKDITERKQAETERRKNIQKLIDSMEATIEAIALTVEMRDMYTAGHQRRVTKLAVAIADELGLSEAETNGIRLAGIVHDIGKIQVPAEILNKPGRLSELEFKIIKNHPQAGYEILKNIKFAWPVAEIVYQHHERLNGSGYPRGLSSNEILLEARILAVADVVEAMATHRPYRAALGVGKALEEIAANRGILYDDAIVNACYKVFYEKGFKFD